MLGTLIYRLGELILLFLGVLPGLLMFWPVFVTTKLISMKKSKEALAASTVKLQGRDVITTWKLLVAMGVAPALYVYYTLVISFWLSYNRSEGYYTHQLPWWTRARTYVPDWVSMKLFSPAFFILCISITFAALRIGEVGMDVLKSLPPLFVALNPRSSASFSRLQQRRQALSVKVTDVINELGPEVFPDFDARRIVADPFREGAYQSSYRKMPDTPKGDEPSEPPTPTSSGFDRGDEDPNRRYSVVPSMLPSNETFQNIGGFGFFASRPQTPKSRSRSSSAGGALNSDRAPFKGFTSLDSREGFDQLSKRIRGAMRERGRKRESEGAETGTESSCDMASDGEGQMTPKTEDSGEEPKKER